MSGVQNKRSGVWDLLKVLPLMLLSVPIVPIALMPPRPDMPVAVMPMPFADRAALRAHVWAAGGYVLDEARIGLIAQGKGADFLTALRMYGPIALVDASQLGALCGQSKRGLRDV